MLKWRKHPSLILQLVALSTLFGCTVSLRVVAGPSPSPSGSVAPSATPTATSTPAPTPTPTITPAPTPTGIAGQVRQIVAGSEHNCVLFGNDQVRCWGYGGDGELGDGVYDDSSDPTLVRNLGTGIRSIGASGYSTCAVFNDGTVKCWGWNGYGQLGDGTTNDSASPVTVAGLDHVIQVSGGQDHTCAIKDNGELWCWGRNQYGQLGNGTTNNSSAPLQVAGISNAIKFAGAWPSSCVVLLNGTVKCWGRNQNGDLGDGTFTDSRTPVTVLALTDAVSISGASWDDFFCALRSGGAASCWGSNWGSQLGDGGTTDSGVPIALAGQTGIRDIVAGGDGFTCILLNTGRVKCVGYGGNGNLGDGTTNDSSAWVNVQSVTDAKWIAAGGDHACVVNNDESVMCWGGNYDGQIGIGSVTDAEPPQYVRNLYSDSPVRLVFTSTPSNELVGTPFATQPVLEIQDRQGVVYTAADTVSLTVHPGFGCSTAPNSTLTGVTSVATVNGVATFSGLQFDQMGWFSLRAASANGAGSECVNFYMTGPTLTFSALSTTNLTGLNFSTQPVVRVMNPSGSATQTSPDYTVTLAAYTDWNCTTPAAGTLSVTANPVTTSSGFATFAGVKYDQPGGIYLKASAPGAVSACTSVYMTQPSLQFTALSSSSKIDTVFAVQPQVKVVAPDNSVLTSPDYSVTLSAFTDSSCTTAATGTLSAAANPVTSSSGLIAFSGVKYNIAEPLYLKASAPGTSSACRSINILPAAGVPYQLTFDAYTSKGVAGTALPGEFRISVRDSDWVILTNATHAVTLAAFTDGGCNTPASGSLSAQANPVNALGGVARFKQVTYSSSGKLYLKASAAGLKPACFAYVDLGPGTGIASRLEFTQSNNWSNLKAGILLNGQPIVSIRDGQGNTLLSDSSTVTLATYSDSWCTTPLSALRADATSVAAVQGQAKFSGVAFTQSGTVYLQARTASLSTNCQQFTVAAGCDPSLTSFAGGNGTLDNPYQITNATQLSLVRSNLACSFRLMNDIDLNGVAFAPLGTTSTQYQGVFDGNGKRIQNWSHTDNAATAAGFFTVIGESGIVKNLSLVNASLTSTQAMTGLLASTCNGIIDNCQSSGTVSGKTTGGLAGALGSIGTLRNSSSSASVSGTNLVGGVIGYNYGAVEFSSASGNISSTNIAGGLVGYHESGSIRNSFATGNVSCTSFSGGLVSDSKGVISTSWASGSVTSTNSYNGGLLSYNRGWVQNSYATGAVNANYTQTGALIGGSWNPTIFNSYATGAVPAGRSGVLDASSTGVTAANNFWDTQTTGTTLSLTGTGKTTAEMQTQSTFTGWDFTNIWQISAGSYPTLRANAKNPPVPMPMNINVNAGVPKAITLNGYSLGGGVLSYQIVTPPSNGTLSAAFDDNTYYYTSNADFAGGTDSFTFRALDASGQISLGTATVSLTILSSCDPTLTSSFAGGTGGIYDPYLVSTVAQLQLIRNNVSCSYKLQNDIDLNGVSFNPIATRNDPFTGNFDGNGKTISNFSYSAPAVDTVGFFAATGGQSKISNLRFTNLSVSGKNEVGGVVGYHYGELSNVHVSGSVSGNAYVGGVAGYQGSGPTQSNLSMAGSVSASNAYAGGIMGVMNIALGSRFFNTATVYAGTVAGGLVGVNYSKVEDSGSIGAVSVNSGWVGGLFGAFSGFTSKDIKRCYASGTVGANTTGSVGGLLGNYWDAPLNFIDTYWDSQVSGVSTTAGTGGTPRTTAQMQTQSNYNGWDFTSVWQISAGQTPRLR